MPVTISDISGVATAAGVIFGAAQLLLNRAQGRTSFEDGLSSQYREMIKPGLAGAILEPLAPEERDRVAPYYEYLDLCNEQVLLRMQGRVRRKTWDEWRLGIKVNVSRGAISHAWNAAYDYLDEFDELRLLREKHYVGDPRTWNPRWRRLVRRELPASALRTEQPDAN